MRTAWPVDGDRDFRHSRGRLLWLAVRDALVLRPGQEEKIKITAIFNVQLQYTNSNLKFQSPYKYLQV